MFTDLIIFFVMESHPYVQGRRVGSVALRTLLNRVLHVVLGHLEIHEFEAELSAIVLDR